MNTNVAKALVVSKVLVADGMMHDEERAFLAELMTQLGLSEAEKQQVIELEGLDQASAVVTGLPEDERRDLIATLVDASSADGTLSAHELATVQRLTKALGL